MLSMYSDFVPKFVKVFGNVGQEMTKAFTSYHEEVLNGSFPGPEHCFKIDDSVIDKLY